MATSDANRSIEDECSAEDQTVIEAMAEAVDYSKWTVNELKDKLRALNLQTSGKKAVLVERVKAAMQEDDEEDDEVEEGDENSQRDSHKEQAKSEYEYPVDFTKHFHLGKTRIRFEDVADTIQSFSGDEGENVQRWIEQFEATAEMSNWSEVEMIINAKRKLVGSAKLWAQFESRAKVWVEFKAGLMQEFKQTVNSKQVHKQLATTKKQRDESAQAFVYRMLQIASHIEIEVESVIQYIIDGIQDEERNKTILYGAETIKELRKKLQMYENFKKNCAKSKIDNATVGELAKKPVTNQNIIKRCFNCGGKGHVGVNCPDKASGTKCFKCGGYGHIAPKCTSAGRSSESPKQDRVRVDMLSSGDKKTYKMVNILGNNVNAVIDPGSDLHLIRASLYIKLGAPQLEPSSVLFDSVGVVGKSTLGRFAAQLLIDGLTFNFVFEVIPDYYVGHDLIIGGEISDYAEVKIKHRQAILSEITAEWKPNDGGVFEEILNIDVLDEPDADNGIEISHVSSLELKQKLSNLVENYEPKQSKNTGVELRIVLKDDIPVHQHPRRLSQSQLEVVRAIIAKWHESGVVRPSISEYASPIVLVEKRNHDYRLCVDYRELNKKVIRDRHPLPLIEDQLDRLQDATVFSTLDLKEGFFHVPVEESSRRYTSFVIPDEQWEFCRVPFGFANSPAVFQRHVRVVFTSLIAKGVVLVYLDDLIVPAKTEAEALERLELVLETASEYGLNINWEKCKLLVTSVEYLGYIIEKGRFFPSSRKTMAVAKFPTPSTIKQVQSFLGLTGYFRKFIPQFALRARPLSDLLRDDAKFHFGPEQEAAFEDLKSALLDKPVLRLYQINAETELHTDACQYGLGAILLQKNVEDGRFHPIYFASWKTSVGEEKYTSFELEFLAVIKAVKKFRIYLLGISFKIVTDCRAFALTLKKKDSCLRVSHWVLLLEQFKYTIEHRPGTAMKHVDALSRNPVGVMCTKINKESLIARVQKAQSEDVSLKEMFESAKDETTQEFELKTNGVLYRIKDGVEQLVIPRNMQYEVIRQAHERGHFSCKKTEYLLLQEFWFPQLHSKVQKFISNCIKCIVSERKTGKAEGWYNSVEKGEAPLDTYHVDFLGPIPSTKKSYNHLYVVVDAFCKFAWIYPTKSVTADEAINCLKRQACIFGNPRCIVSDRGSAFTSHAFREYCEEENICHRCITTGVPRGNGQVERLNRIIISVLTKLSVDNPMQWYKHLSAVQQMLNSTLQRSIGKTPFELLVGTKMKVKEDFELRKMIEKEMVECFEEHRQELRNDARINLLKVQEENRKTYNKKRKSPRQYCVGDLVAIQRTQFGTGLKIAPKFLGPYRVTSVMRSNRYMVEKVGTHEGPGCTSSSADLMKPWSDGELEDNDIEIINEDV